MCRLEHMYIKTQHSPIPRPIMPHWPRRWHGQAGGGRLSTLGHVDDLLVSAHFSQPNSAEFDNALRWRTLRTQHAFLKYDLHREHAVQLKTLMKRALKVGLLHLCILQVNLVLPFMLV